MHQHGLFRFVTIVAFAAIATSCGDDTTSTDEDVSSDSTASVACTVADGEAFVTISCPDGTTVRIANTPGLDGSSCSVASNNDGTSTVSCDDGTSVTVSDGEPGVDGQSCSVVDNNDGSATISCDDGTTATVADGVDGSSCSVTDNLDGTKTISCDDGTTVMVSDGTSVVSVGTINGSVTGDQGAAVENVTISTIPASTTAMSDATGTFTLTDVPIGVYTIVATAAGYEDFTLTGVGVAAGGAVNVSLTMIPVTQTTGTISGTVHMVNGNPLPGATVTVEGQTTSDVSAADGTFTLASVTPGYAFLQVESPDLSLFLPGETRKAILVVGGGTNSGVEITLSGRPSDTSTYVGNAECVSCHVLDTASENVSAHHRSLQLDKVRMVSLELFPAVGGTVTTGVNAMDPDTCGTAVAVYACQNTAGDYGFKFGGTADCTVADGTLIPIVGTYGGEGNGGVDDIANVGVFKQRYFADLADVAATAGWTYTSGKNLDKLIIPVQITQSGDGVPLFAGYHGADWCSRGRTFSRKCSGCHNNGLQLTWEAGTNYVTSYSYIDFNVGCENCHGPGSQHIAEPTATIANTIISSSNLTAKAQRDACGGCHAADEGHSLDPLGGFGFPYNVANAAIVGGGVFVPGVFEVSDYIQGYGVTQAQGGGFNAWPDGLHGRAHRQQVPMLEASVHTNNPTMRMVCGDCHDAHSLQQGPEEYEVDEGSDTYGFANPTFHDNTLCLSCHATHADGPFADLSVEQVALSFLNSGGSASRNGTALSASSFTAAEILEAKVAIAEAVGDHMQDEVAMGGVAYNPTNDEMPVGRCESCHMPRVAKSGGYTTGVDALGNSALVEGDQVSHVFDIIWPAQSAALLRSGGADTDIMPNSCGKCHEGARLSGD